MRGSRVLLAVLAVVGVAHAQFFQFGNTRQMPEVKGTVRLEPAEAVVGIPCSFVFSFDTKSTVNIQRIGGMPEDHVEYLAETLEPYADGSYRLPVRFLAPCTNRVLNLSVSGMQTVEQGKGTAFRSTYSSSFQKRLPPFRIDVRPLPEEGRPLNFSGAVGTKFTMTQKLEPDHVHPGDLVTATYTLTYDGYCPSNAWPRIDHLSKEFKAYEPKEIARTSNSITWTQVLVPRTTAATNSALVSLTYYNSRVRRYEVARAYPKKLVFVSDKAASTQNTAVTVTAAESVVPTPAGVGAGAMLELRFAPSASARVIATLPPNTPVKELSRHNGWCRLETPVAIGWSR